MGRGRGSALRGDPHVSESVRIIRMFGPIRIVGTLMSRLKTGGRLIRHARYFTLQLAESYLTGSLFRRILQRVEQLTWHPT